MSTTQQLESALRGRYEVEREIGAGGMATVYRARDLRHDRHVALKVLRPELSAILGAERFLKEIRTTANLQHPHILPLHDSGEANGLVFYVMPFVEGESLRDRLTRETQLPVDDAVRIAREVASALDYAHRHGVVHRDIKPENILLNDGQALVADFGIALAASAAGGGTRLTETGMSLGTPHYMSPEQAMGEREITPRSDVYALGCVLYEMLLGEPPFTGPTAQAIVARVMTEEPRSPTTQRKSVPPHVAAAVLTALAKIPADRFATAAEFAVALGTRGYTGVGTAALAAGGGLPAARWITDRRTIGTLLAATAVVALAAFWPRGRMLSGAAEGVVTRLRIVPEDTTPGLYYSRGLHGAPAVSPDGRVVAFTLGKEDTSALYVQPLDRFEQWSVVGGGRRPFFSPDGRSIGFMRGGSVWKVPVTGGTPTRLGSVETDASAWTVNPPGVWHPDGRIYFATSTGLRWLPAAGGTARTIASGDTTSRLDRIGEMSLTPDSRLLVSMPRRDTVRLAIVSPDGDVRFLPVDVGAPAWFVGDILVFTRERQLYASAFDLRDLRTSAEPVPITDPTDEAHVSPGQTAAWFDVAVSRRVEPVWVSRSGQITPVGLAPGAYRWPRLSPDGRRVALLRTGERLIEVVDVAAGSRSRLAQPGGEPVWFRDGSRVLTWASAGPQYGLITQFVDANRVPDTLIAVSREHTFPTDVSAGDSLLLYYGNAPGESPDVFVLDLRTKTSRRIARPGYQRGARFSPDGRWIALQSLDGGRREVVVVPWPALDAQHVVSSDGGEEPAWSHDGRELYFRIGGRMFAVTVTPGAAWSATPPAELFRGPFASDPYGDQSFDVAPDGRFFMLRFAGDARPQLRVIHNWAAELTRKLAEAQR
jgi:Tol biopolymer transport system component